LLRPGAEDYVPVNANPVLLWTKGSGAGVVELVREMVQTEAP